MLGSLGGVNAKHQKRSRRTSCSKLWRHEKEILSGQQGPLMRWRGRGCPPSEESGSESEIEITKLLSVVDVNG